MASLSAHVMFEEDVFEECHLSKDNAVASGLSIVQDAVRSVSRV